MWHRASPVQSKEVRTTKEKVPMVKHLLPDCPWETVLIELLQLTGSRQSSQYFLESVDHFSRFVVPAPVKSKTVAWITHLLCLYTTPRVPLSDNGEKFWNSIIAEICSQCNNTSQTSTVAYHPLSNGLVESANRKIVDAVRPVVNSVFENNKDWFPQIWLYINHSLSS